MWQEQISSCVVNPIPVNQIHMVRKLLEVKILDEKLQTASLSDGLEIQVKSAKPFTVNSFWIVKIQDIHHEIERDWKTMRDLLWDGKFLHRSQVHNDPPCVDRNEPQIFPQTNEVVNVKICPTKPIDISCMPVPRDFYPLVVIVFCHEEEADLAANDVAANIHLIHIKDDVVPIKSHVIKNYTKQIDGKILDISQLYADDTQVCMICFEDANGEEGLRLFCLLPCRHSPICSTCIRRIRDCPKCRSPIASIFDINAPPMPPPATAITNTPNETNPSDEARDRGPRNNGLFSSIRNFFRI